MAGRDELLAGTGPTETEMPGELVPTMGETTGEAVQEPAPLLDRMLDRLVQWWEDAGQWLPLALAIAVAPGLFAWPLLTGQVGHVLKNDFPLSDRAIAGVAIAVSLLLVGAGYAVAAARAQGARLDALRALNDRLLPLLALPPIPFLLAPGVERNQPWLVFLFAAGIAFVFGRATWQKTPSLRLPGWMPGAISIVVTLAWVVMMSALAIGQHHALETAVYDLGIYDSIFWHSIHGEPLASDFVRGGNHVSGHVDPILVLLSPLYLLYPRAEGILVLQAAWVAAGTIPVWLLARRTLGSWHALGFVLVYLLLPTVHGRTLYHFHSLTLAGPLLLWCFACLELGWTKRYWVGLALLLLTREDMSLLGILLGAFAILGKGRKRLGLVTIVASVVYLAFVKLVVMPSPSLLAANSSDSYGFAYYYEDMIPQKRLGTMGMLLTLITNPIFVVQHVLTEPKLRFFALVFLPFLLLPLVAPRGRLLLSYGLAFVFLASRTAVYSPAFQYATVLDSFVLGLAIISLAHIGQARLPALRRMDPLRARPALLVAMIACTAVLSWKFGALLPNDSFRAGFHKLVREPSESTREAYAWLRKTIDGIAPDASVSAGSVVGPHLSNRGDAYLWPSVRDADYILVEKRELRGDKGRKLKRLESEGMYVRIDEHARFVLLERADRLPEAKRPTPRGQQQKPDAASPVLRRPGAPAPGRLLQNMPAERLALPRTLEVED